MADLNPFHPLTVFEEDRYAYTKYQVESVDNFAAAVFGHAAADCAVVGAAVVDRLRGA